MSELPPTTLLPKTFYFTSLALEAIYLFLFISVFILSIFRTYKKIKNPRFKTQKDEDSNEEEPFSADARTIAKETTDNLIYRFEVEDQEKDKPAD
jgi:hypothetical protein